MSEIPMHVVPGTEDADVIEYEADTRGEGSALRQMYIGMMQDKVAQLAFELALSALTARPDGGSACDGCIAHE